MSSDKMRLKLRIKRLQTMFTELGRDPNAKGIFIILKCVLDYEIKSLIMDFDKIVRKQNARLKKAKH